MTAYEQMIIFFLENGKKATFQEIEHGMLLGQITEIHKVTAALQSLKRRKKVVFENEKYSLIKKP